LDARPVAGSTSITRRPMAEQVLHRVDADGIVVVTVNRPETRNAMSRSSWMELRDLLTGVQSDSDVRGLIITGAGDRTFVSGADVRELADRDPIVALDGLVQRILMQLENIPIPTVAALNGHALGGGWELALACDLRVAVSHARVGFPEIGLGIMPGAGGTLRLLQHVGIGLAKEWILTGRLLDAREAAAHGLINRVVDEGTVLNAANALMDELVAQPRTPVRLAKTLLNATARGEGTDDLERLAYTLTFHGHDRKERMRGFLTE
jgi:enoyl-CoA hydratase